MKVESKCKAQSQASEKLVNLISNNNKNRVNVKTEFKGRQLTKINSLKYFKKEFKQHFTTLKTTH